MANNRRLITKSLADVYQRDNEEETFNENEKLEDLRENGEVKDKNQELPLVYRISPKVLQESE